MTIYRNVCPLLAALFPAPSGRRGGRKTHIHSGVLCVMCDVRCPGGGGGAVLSVCAVCCRVGTRQSKTRKPVQYPAGFGHDPKTREYWSGFRVE